MPWTPHAQRRSRAEGDDRQTSGGQGVALAWARSAREGKNREKSRRGEKRRRKPTLVRVSPALVVDRWPAKLTLRALRVDHSPVKFCLQELGVEQRPLQN